MALNSNAQAVFVANNKVRPLADRVGQLFNLVKALQAEGAAESWTTLFPLAAQAGDTIDDGAAIDGRTVITNQDVRDFITDITTLVNFFEANSNVIRNRALKIAVNPERLSG